MVHEHENERIGSGRVQGAEVTRSHAWRTALTLAAAVRVVYITQSIAAQDGVEVESQVSVWRRRARAKL